MERTIAEQIAGEKPSERLRHALNALQLAEKGKLGAKPNMSFFHRTTSEGCLACLGGLAAIARWVYPNPVPLVNSMGGFARAVGLDEQIVKDYENSLSDVHFGSISGMFKFMKLPEEEGYTFNRKIPDYDVEPEESVKALNNLIADLQKAGY